MPLFGKIERGDCEKVSKKEKSNLSQTRYFHSQTNTCIHSLGMWKLNSLNIYIFNHSKLLK